MGSDQFDATQVSTWCAQYLGSESAETLFTAGNLSQVFGLRLRDGRSVVVEVRPAASRLAGCGVVSAPETVIIGVAAAMWPALGECVGASIEESEQFLEAYQLARGHAFSPGRLEEAWASGTWIRAFNAKKFLLDGLTTLTPAEAEVRARRAGLS